MAPSSASQNMSTSESYNFETLAVSNPHEFVMLVEFNRPAKKNTMNPKFYEEITTCFNKLAVDRDCRVIILAARGPFFTAGMDLKDEGVQKNLNLDADVDASRRALQLARDISTAQESNNAIEKCPKPVIAAVHSGCVGGGVDVTAACDIRYCTEDAWFQIKEVDVGLAADVGTLQRFPKVIGNDSLFRELAYTARRFNADEAKAIGYVSKVLPDRAQMMNFSLEMAKVIASKSPVGVQGSKVSIVYSRDHSVSEGLDHVKTWNSAMLQSDDLKQAMEAFMQKKAPIFSKL